MKSFPNKLCKFIFFSCCVNNFQTPDLVSLEIIAEASAVANYAVAREDLVVIKILWRPEIRSKACESLRRQTFSQQVTAVLLVHFAHHCLYLSSLR